MIEPLVMLYYDAGTQKLGGLVYIWSMENVDILKQTKCNLIQNHWRH